jgi:predicted RNA-binding Zn-ribbon protein involved in translation (DUF1610 family)
MTTFDKYIEEVGMFDSGLLESDSVAFTVCCGTEVSNGYGDIIHCPDCGEQTGLEYMSRKAYEDDLDNCGY